MCEVRQILTVVPGDRDLASSAVTDLCHTQRSKWQGIELLLRLIDRLKCQAGGQNSALQRTLALGQRFGCSWGAQAAGGPGR